MATDIYVSDSPQLTRLRQILECLAQRPHTVSDLVKAIESSRRAFYRDLNELRAMGFVIERARNGRDAQYTLKGWQL
jgi:predicted DNA-binding transcriptional regulator YafY